MVGFWGRRAGHGAAILAGLLFALASCGPIYDTQYSLTPPNSPEGRVCAGQCQQIQSLCNQNCQLRYDSCLAEARADALRDYDAYVWRQNQAGKKVTRSPSSFDYSYRCASPSGCESACMTDFQGCYGGCGGAVSSERVCVAFCQ